MKYPYEKLKLNKDRILKAYIQVCKDIADLEQTKHYLIHELKKLTI